MSDSTTTPTDAALWLDDQPVSTAEVMAVLRKEAGSWAWPAFTLGWTMVLAWVASFLVYQGGRALGLG